MRGRWASPHPPDHTKIILQIIPKVPSPTSPETSKVLISEYTEIYKNFSRSSTTHPIISKCSVATRISECFVDCSIILHIIPFSEKLSLPFSGRINPRPCPRTTVRKEGRYHLSEVYKEQLQYIALVDC